MENSNANKKVVNGNLVQDALRKYEFDTFRNPYYNIYPKAYRIINYINKNNILVTENIYGSNNYKNIHYITHNHNYYHYDLTRFIYCFEFFYIPQQQPSEYIHFCFLIL